MPITVSKALTKVFGSRNERLLKRYHRLVDEVNEIEPKIAAMTDPALRARTAEMKAELAAGKIETTDIMAEAFAIMRESMDRHIGIRAIFDPNNNFDPDSLDDEMLEKYDEVQRRMIGEGLAWQQVSIPPELYGAIRKLYPESRPPFRARCFDVQLIGGLVLYEGRIAEMATGEGKTFVAPLACYLRALEGYHCHVVTVNDYLVRRDALWVQPAFTNLGLTVGFIQAVMEPGGEARRAAYQCDVTYGTNAEFGFDFLRDNMKETASLQVQGPLDFAIVDEVDSILIDEARTPLIISGPAHDNAPKYRDADAVARKVIELNKQWDSADAAEQAAKRAIKATEGDLAKVKGDKPKELEIQKRRQKAEQDLADAEARKQGLTQYYEVELDRKSVHLTHDGFSAAQEAAGVGSFFVGNNVEWPHLMEQAMRAHVVYEKDKDYVVERGNRTGQMEVVIVDEYTGRKMEGRQWSDGLHQAVEAKERVQIKQETQTLATITLQNFFRMYRALSGMTGTAQTEAEEFSKIYGLEVVTIPTNRKVIRMDQEDRVYRTEREKWESIIEEIKLYSEAGRPVLVGTTSVEKSEMLSNMLKRKYGVEHEVLNAKHHEREAEIVQRAGQMHKDAHGQLVGNVTIATNMAGRGTDIKPAQEAFFEVTQSSKGAGGKWIITQRGTKKTIEVNADGEDGEENPLVKVFQLKDGAKVVGGLHVVGTERHTSRRIDNQLRGRSGRQGDPGSSRFYISLQDDLMKMFAGDWTIKVLGWIGMEEGMAIEDRRITKAILRAQKKVEERNFLARKSLLDYDEVMEYQRNDFYGKRQRVLLGKEVDTVIWDMIDKSIDDAVAKYVTDDYVASTVSEWARQRFDVAIDPSDLRGMRDVNDLEKYVKDKARAEAITTINSTIGEYLGDDAENALGWDTKGLQGWAMSAFKVNLSQSQIRQMSAKELEAKLRDAAVEQVDHRDVSELMKFLVAEYPERELSAWAKEKFGVEVKPEEMMLDIKTHTPKPTEEIAAMIGDRARAAYARREVEYPVDHALTYAFGGVEGAADDAYAADYIRTWAKRKYDIDLTLDQVRSTNLRELRDLLIKHQRELMTEAKQAQIADQLIASNPDLMSLRNAVNERFNLRLAVKDFENPKLPVDEPEEGEVRAAPTLRDYVLFLTKQFARRELTDLEQFVLIQIFDTTWKDHLFAMDILKGGIGLHAFAEVDPRVMYKTEGYAFFEQMLASVRDKVTDLIFRARVVGATQARNAYRETAAVHAAPTEYGVHEMAQREGAAAPAAEGGEKSEEVPKVKTIVREAEKVGRNDPCPCGSGKKYKKCCGAQVAA